MLKITTSNGDVLVHADQQPDSYNGRSADGSTYMVHGGSWGKHKYIRKEGDRYIYPEDLEGRDNNRFNNVKGVDDQKSVIDAKKKWFNGSAAKARSAGALEKSAREAGHEGAASILRRDYKEKTKKAGEDRNEYLRVRDEAARNHNGKLISKDIESEKRSAEEKRKKINQQRKSAHAGYESDKKKFPEGGSTEELELQKRKTASRKARKESIEAIKRANKEESQIRSAHQGYVNRPAGDHKTMMLEYQINKKKRNDDLEAKKAKQKSEYTQKVAQQNAEYKKKRKQTDDEFQQKSNQMQSDHNKKVAQSKMDYARRKRAMQDRQEQYEKEYIKKHPIKGRALKTGSYYLNKYVKEKEKRRNSK